MGLDQGCHLGKRSEATTREMRMVSLPIRAATIFRPKSEVAR
jgi:hypothetical protein